MPATEPEWEWADDIDPTALNRMTTVTLALFEKPERWIHRRIERIYFKDHHRVHHQISVDFTLPSGLPPIGESDGKNVYIAPLFLLEKEAAKPLRMGIIARRFLIFRSHHFDASKPPLPTAPYSNIDFTDNDGHRLPLITRRQSSLLAKSVLLEAAEQAIQHPVTGKLRNEISAISYRDWADLEKVLDWLLNEDLTDTSDHRYQLRSDDIFRELAYTLASHSIIACLLIDGAPRRSIYKLSYDEPVNESESKPRGSLLRSLGWQAEQYFVSLNEIGAGASYHVEIAVPGELEINSVSLVGKRYKRFRELRNKPERDYLIQQVGKANEGNIYIPDPLPGRRVGLAWVELRAKRSGFLAGALAASALTTLLLWLGVIASSDVIDDGKFEPATAALLLAPALVAAFIVRPGQHAITVKMLRWARIILVLNAALPALAVFFLLITHDNGSSGGAAVSLTSLLTNLGALNHLVLNTATQAANSAGALRLSWMVVATLSTLLSLLFVISYILPIPYGETTYEPMPREEYSE